MTPRNASMVRLAVVCDEIALWSCFTSALVIDVIGRSAHELLVRVDLVALHERCQVAVCDQLGTRPPRDLSSEVEVVLLL